jgi:hypothetical protein
MFRRENEKQKWSTVVFFRSTVAAYRTGTLCVDPSGIQ